jgi:hypothetical protein
MLKLASGAKYLRNYDAVEADNGATAHFDDLVQGYGSSPI